MAEATTTKSSRWSDKWPVRVMTTLLGLTAMVLISGATWLVRTAVDGKAEDARRDAKVEALERGQTEILDTLKEIRADVKELRK